jgi:hypothetical protein
MVEAVLQAMTTICGSTRSDQLAITMTMRFTSFCSFHAP